MLIAPAMRVLLAFLYLQEPASSARRLSVEQAKTLVKNVPDALVAQKKHGCVAAEYDPVGPDFGMIQLRNSCPRSGSGLIGNYVIDLRSGQIWYDIDRTRPVDSPQLKRLRDKMLPASK